MEEQAEGPQGLERRQAAWGPGALSGQGPTASSCLSEAQQGLAFLELTQGSSQPPALHRTAVQQSVTLWLQAIRTCLALMRLCNRD